MDFNIWKTIAPEIQELPSDQQWLEIMLIKVSIQKNNVGRVLQFVLIDTSLNNAVKDCECFLTVTEVDS